MEYQIIIINESKKKKKHFSWILSMLNAYKIYVKS